MRSRFDDASMGGGWFCPQIPLLNDSTDGTECADSKGTPGHSTAFAGSIAGIDACERFVRRGESCLVETLEFFQTT